MAEDDEEYPLISEPSPPLPASSEIEELPDDLQPPGGSPHSAAPASAAPPPRPPDSTTSCCNSIITIAALFLVVYLSLGVLVYWFNPGGYSGVKTHRLVDAIYFCIVTLCTIGYGDIVPFTTSTKIVTCLLVLVGFGIAYALLSAAVSYALDLQQKAIMARARDGARAAGFIVDTEKGQMRIRMKVGIAIGIVSLCIGAGALALYYMEHLDWTDSIYLSVMSVTTVGYGDRAFKTLRGRVFASFWLLVSTLAVARAYLCLAEAQMGRISKVSQRRDATRDQDQLEAADTDHSEFMSKSEFVIHKLLESEKITASDILPIYDVFNRLDPDNTGKIARPR